ncbi:MAG: DUF2604 domain-containing protein [Clostridiales bacterium]|nr:DUF2604 domain-containing protein [Clostridiales bacterium]
MPQYRRLISYIYAYEGGEKGKSVGFAKLEIRGSRCVIYINVKKIYVGGNDIGVYLLTQDSEILLGRIFVRGGAGEFRATVNADNIEDSGRAIGECYGLSVHDVESAWQCYTTIWEDAVAHAAEIELAGVTAENVRRKQKQEEQKTAVGEKQQTPVEADAGQSISAEAIVGQSISVEANEGQPFSAEADVGLPISAEVERALEREENQEQDPVPWEDSNGEVTGEQLQMEAREESDRLETMQVSRPEPGDPERLAELERQEREQDSQERRWNQLQRHYTKVLAFDSEHGCEILSIKPQDIGLLPRETWVYGNNSFLLHGYYSYRHLILARLENPGGAPRYLLGVPGHYFSNEKNMAAMFGFPGFVLAKKQPQQDERFGYWYTDIRL